MKPADFQYFCPDTVDEATSLLAVHAGRAKIIAGGQSLIPMMNFRVVRPEVLIDIGRLLDLDYLKEGPCGTLIAGSRTRHYVFQTHPLVAKLFPVIPAAMNHVAHVAIRNRGTIGGSLTHADPAAEWPMLALLLDATIELRSHRGTRTLSARDFLLGSLTSAIEEDELLTQVTFPGLPENMGWAFDEVSRRPGDFALAACGVLLEKADGYVRSVRIGMMGVGETALRAHEAEQMLLGKRLDDSLAAEAAAVACAALAPPIDLHGSPDYRRHLATVLVERCLKAAWARTLGEA